MKARAFLLIIFMHLSAFAYAQEASSSLASVLAAIRDAQTDQTIHFMTNELEHLTVGRIPKDLTARNAVERACKGLPVKVKRKGRHIFVQYKPEKDFTGKKIHLSGEVRDGFLDMPLPHARISVFKADSTLVADSLRMVVFYRGDMRIDKAVFNLDVSAAEREYLVRGQMDGYDDVWQRVAINDPSQDEVDVPSLKMRKSTARTMREVTVTATKIKMFWRGDTLVYDATAFRLPEGSMLDDLIRQLPGVTMNADGEIFVNGRKVDELLLGSRSFFGGNKKVLLENLPYYTVRHLKVYEKQTDRSVALGYDVDPRRYVMDVILKDEYNQGYIGNVEAAGGTDERWLGRGFLLGFTDKLRFTLLANANNVNESRHIGQSDQWSPARQPRSLLTTRSVAGELNYEAKNGKNKEIKETFRAEYTSTTDDQTITQRTERFIEGCSPTSVTESFNRAGNRRWTLNNHLAMRLPAWMDVYANFDYAQRDGSFHSAFDEQSDSLSIAQRTVGISEGTKWNAKIDVQGSVRPGKQKSHIDYYVSMGHNSDEGESASHYQTTDSPPALPVREGAECTERASVSSLNSSSLFNHNTWGVVNLGYGYEIAKDLHLGFSNMLYKSHVHTRDYLYHPDTLLLPSQLDALEAITDYANSYESRSDTWQNDFTIHLSKSSYYMHPQVHMRVNYDRWRLELKLPVYSNKLHYQRGKIDTLARQRMFLPEPKFWFRHSWKGALRDFQAHASFRQSMPLLIDRINFRDDSQPLIIKLGNSDLKSTAVTHFDARYYDGTGRNQGMYNLTASFDYHHRDIAQSIAYTPYNGVYTYKPMNVSGAYQAHANFSTDHNIGEKRYWSWHVNTGADWNHAKDHALLEGQTESQVNTVNTLSLNSGANIRYNYKTLNVRAVGSMEWRHSEGRMYDFSTLNALDFSYGLEATYTTPALCGKKVGGMTLAADACMYSRRGYGSASLNRDDFVVNASISQPLLSGKLIVRLDAFDLLHQLSPTDYVINAQGRTITTYRSLPHYVMLHAVWHWNRNPKRN
ncbi:MAG: outer membrane beta-barrel protein [Bacteroidaceae bacterium]|nr:outer membrane beta-barrel protein [Bacteroidaceae bacterium]